MPSEYYTNDFYEAHRSGAMRSAEIMAPLVLQVVRARSIVDVGCGDGSWLSVFRKLGVDDIFGVDGDYVDRRLLQIPEDSFKAFDLAKPFFLGRTFDLAVSLEVAEHLPADSAAVFVECLTGLAPLVLFSAAIPFQGGDHHINEQWPDKWAALFGERGYVAIDFIRKLVWQNDGVEWWYAQNTLLFARINAIESNPFLKAEFEQTRSGQLALVHPKQYLYLEGRYREAASGPRGLATPSGVRAAAKLLVLCLKNAVSSRLWNSRRNPEAR